jgi:hypothetical protein
MGLRVPGDTMVFWVGPAGTDPDTYDADHGRAMDMAVVRYTELLRLKRRRRRSSESLRW